MKVVFHGAELSTISDNEEAPYTLAPRNATLFHTFYAHRPAFTRAKP